MNLSMVEFLLQQAWQSIRRNGLMSLATSSNMTVALLILSAFLLATINLEHMADVEARKANITVDLAEGADAGEVEATLLGDMRVEETRYRTRDQALREQAEAVGMSYEQLNATLPENPLPDSIVVKPVDPQDMAAIAQAAEKIEGVAEVRYQEQITGKLLILARGIRIAGVISGVVMGAATLLIVSTTIRLTIYARRREIRIMQLVGATNWFIRLPFILEGAFHGVVGGAVSMVLVLASYSWAHGYVSEHLGFIELIYSARFAVLFALGAISCGTFFGVLGSILGLHSYLRNV
ncbi:MAG: ABC transporter permease [candidate division WS1 bacterium]|jgi:cell division transport system permease protein|nr:ABC transporter permease [candidate division WS1 bacterium]